MKFVVLLWLFPFLSLAKSNIVFVTEYLSPYQIIDDRNQLVAGTSHAVVAELIRRAEVSPSFIVMPWARAYKTALEQKNTFIYSIARSPQRENLFDWVGQLRQLRFHFYGLSRSSLHVNLALKEILNQRVAAVRGSIEEDLLKQVGFTEENNLIMADSYPTAWQQVLIGRADTVYSNEDLAKSMPSALGLEQSPFQVIYTLNQVLDLYIAANKESDALLVLKMKDVLEEMRKEGTVNAIVAEQERLIFQRNTELDFTAIGN